MLRSQYRAGGFLPGIHEMTLCGTQYKTRQMNDSQDREKTFVSRSRLSFILHRAISVASQQSWDTRVKREAHFIAKYS